jgi:dihydrofolate reductase
MGRLIYSLNVSLDGYVESRQGDLDWSVVDDELHSWFNDRFRTIDASLYGRGLYETMAAYWPTAEQDPEATETEREFARIWNSTPRIVFSTTLREVGPGSRLVQGDVGEIPAAVREEFRGDLEVAGATLASEFVRRGLVDEYQVLIHPVILGGGKRYLPELESPIPLRLTDTRTFGSGVVYLGYRTR